VAATLFTPHLWWQYSHDFPTLKYHFSGRTSQISFRYVGEYLSQQVVAIGPGLIFIPFVCRAKNVFEQTLKFIIVGTFGFFLASSFKTFVHFHWTSIAVYPLLYFAVAYYHEQQTKKLFQWLIIPFVVLFFIARLLLMVPFIRNMHVGEDYYHGRKAWAKEIAGFAGNKPVFIPNNLREASLYAYYSGKMGVTLYNRPEKKSQYDLWGYEDSLQGKDVLFVTKYPFSESKERVMSTGQKLYYATIPSFQSFYTGITINAAIRDIGPSDTVLLSLLEIINERKEPVTFLLTPGNQRASLVYFIEKGKQVVKADVLQPFSPADAISSGAGINKMVAVPLRDLPKGEYQVYFGIRNGVLPDAVLSKGYALRVK
jgi:hypothetical protein